MGVLALVLIAGIGAVETATQPVVSCAPLPGASSKPPATLVTAQDYFEEGDFEFDRGNCDAAITAYSRAIELNPNFAEAYNNRAYTYMVKKDYADALTDLDKAIELRPNYVNALMSRGDIHNYYYNIDYDRAIADYDRVLAQGPEAYQQTSLCGHRMLAMHHGWDATVFLEVLTRGPDSGCTRVTPGY
jgi:tetratricopeptide (TPR) repeat protein